MTDWQSALEALPVVAFAIDDDARFAWLNAEARRVLGGGADHLVGRRYTERVHPDDREGAFQRFKRLSSGTIGAYRADVRYLDCNDRPIWFRISARRLDAEEAADRRLTLAIAQTIGESEAEHAVLERSERQLRLALSASGAGAWDWDLATDVVEYSQSFLDLLRYRGRDFHIDFVFRERLHPEDRDRVIAAVHRSLAEDAEFDETYRLLCFDARHRWFHGRGRTVRDAEGRALRFSGVLLDWELQHAARSALVRSEKRMRYFANHDLLTGLKNRRAWQDDLADLVQTHRSAGGRFAVLLIDLDLFKNVNDSLGHATGDRLLNEVAFRMRRIVGPGNLLARLGGDEFVCCVTGEGAVDMAESCANALLQAIARPWRPRTGVEIAVGASIGIARFPEHGADTEALLAAADAALYSAKAAGRGTVRVYDVGLRHAAAQRLQLETRLRRAIEEGALHVAYQPIRRTACGMPIASEALLRWDDAQLGSVEPSRFIPVAEAAGLMPVLGAWMRDAAFAAFARWSRSFASEMKLAVNISAHELVAADFVDHFHDALSRHGLPAHAIVAEITESTLIDNASPARAHAEQLRALGVQLAIDDFGLGYSSLAMLKRMRVDQIKIDRSFVDGVDRGDDDDRAICAAVISMARQLGLEVVAEGVERESQRQVLDELGCTAWQGFLDDGAPIDEAGLLARLRGDPRAW